MNKYGAAIERGLITASTEDGFIVESLDRNGVESPPIGQIHNETLTVGDKVYFFLNTDGTGKIICLINSEEGQAALDIYVEQIIANTAARHTHPNKTILDLLYPMTNTEIEEITQM